MFGIRNRIIGVILLLTTLSLTFIGIYLLNFFHTQNLASKQQHLITNAKIVKTAIADDIARSNKYALIENIKRISDSVDLRITVLDANCNVLADSWEIGRDLENHADRQEIKDALRQEYSASIRYSSTISENMLYVAIPVYHKQELIGIVRTATTLAPIEAGYRQTQLAILSALCITIILTILVGIWLAHKSTRPIEIITKTASEIASGNLSKRLELHTNDEIEILAHTLNHLTSRLETRITASKAEAEKLSLILENMDNAVILFDQHGNISTVNHHAKKIFHICDEMLGKHSISVIGSSELTHTANEVLTTRQTKTIYFKTEINQQSKTFTVFFAPVDNIDDDTTNILSVFHDISALQEIYEHQAEFVANASHELKTPLTSIKGFTETLLDGAYEEPELCKKFITIIHEEADRMHQLIQGLLQLAKLDNNEYRQQITNAPIDIAQLFTAINYKLQPQITNKQQSLTIDIENTMPIFHTNYDWLLQILMNLTENASKYTPEKGTIILRSYTNENKCIFQIKDNGVGISPTDLPFIFDRFYRADKAHAKQAGSYGIGLSIVHAAVEMLGGKIEVTSTLNQGTTFTICFLCSSVDDN